MKRKAPFIAARTFIKRVENIRLQNTRTDMERKFIPFRTTLKCWTH